MSTSEFSSRASSPQFDSLMNEIRDTVLVFLNAQFNDLFSSTDEALIDFAEQAQSTAMQGRFFEAMGAVRKYRLDIEHEFRRGINQGFDEFGKPKPKTDDQDTLEMALIEPDDMEESVASENLILKSRDNYYTQLYALEQRIAVVNQGRKLPLEDIPSSPHHLVKAFRTSILTLAIDVKAKIVLYALFDKFVMRQLKSLYDEVNSTLKQAGILPNLKPVFTSPTQPESDAPEQDSEMNPDSESTPPNSDLLEDTEPVSGLAAPPQQSLGEELFDSILELMATRHQSTGSQAQAPDARQQTLDPGSQPAYSAASAGGQASGTGQGGGPARQRLMSAIDSIRPSSVQQPGGVLSNIEALPEIAVDPQFLDRLKQTIHDERDQIYAQVDRTQLDSIDADTIDLIGMLFEYMLNDPLLPNLAKALLSHLHTPYLKLSLTDRQLLVDSEHPARLLLDMLVEAGGQWVYENDTKRGIFPHMQSVVDRVLQEFTDNDNLFPELLDYFKASMDEQRRKSDAIEQRAQESVKGREKLQVAKQRAAQEMKARSEQAALPNAIMRFLTQAWNDRLVFILLRHADGEESREWRLALQLADDLVWLFDPQESSGSEHERAEAGISIKREIEKALDSLGGYHQSYIEELFTYLEDPSAITHWQAKQSQAKDADTAVRNQPRQTTPTEKAAAGAKKTPPTQKTAEPAADAQITSDGELSEREKDMVDKLQNLKFGTWFEFKQKEGFPRRLKLSWLSPLTSTCMFVDRAGIQAEVKTLAEIARMMHSGQAKLIPRPKHQFIERALMAIKKTLQRSMEATD